MDINIHNVKKITKTVEKRITNHRKCIDFAYYELVVENDKGEKIVLCLMANNSTNLEIIEETL